MMDKQLVFCEAHAGTATFQSDAIDFGHDYPSTGLNDTPLYVVVQGTGMAGTGTLTVAVQDSADGSTDWQPVLSSGALNAATLNGGAAIPMPLKHRRYVRLNVTASTTAPTAGTVTAFLSDAINVPMSIPKVGIEFIPTTD